MKIDKAKDASNVERKNSGEVEYASIYKRREQERSEGKTGALGRYDAVLKKLLGFDTGEVVENPVGRDYVSLFSGGEKFEVVFSSTASNGDIFLIDGKWKVVLKNETLESLDIREGDNEKFLMLGSPLTVRIIDISKSADGRFDEVSVELAGSSRWEKREALKRSVRKEIENALKHGGKAKVLGRIVANRGYDATVDIMGLQITGLIKPNAWRNAFTRSLKGIAKEGEWYEFHVTQEMPKKKGAEVGYRLSRVAFSHNDWKNSGIIDLEVGSKIVVMCNEVIPNKPYWLGVTERIKGFEVQGDYTDKFREEKGIYPGTSYICDIKKVEVWKDGQYVPFEFKSDTEWDSRDGFRVTVKPLEVVEADLEMYLKKMDLPPVKKR